MSAIWHHKFFLLHFVYFLSFNFKTRFCQSYKFPMKWVIAHLFLPDFFSYTKYWKRNTKWLIYFLFFVNAFPYMCGPICSSRVCLLLGMINYFLHMLCYRPSRTCVHHMCMLICLLLKNFVVFRSLFNFILFLFYFKCSMCAIQNFGVWIDCYWHAYNVQYD